MNKHSYKTPLPELDALIPILIGVWRRFHKLSGPPDKLQTREFRSVVAAIQVLKEYSTNDGKSLIGENYFNNPDLLGAYLLYQWILHYQEALSLIGELPTKPKRVLDLCSGPAPFAFAALRHGAQEVVAVDQNVSALTLGAEVCGRYGLPLSIRKWHFPKETAEGQFDLIMLGHCLEELFPSNRKGWEFDQQRFVKDLIERNLSPSGFILLVESSFPAANQRLLHLRQALINEGVPVQAPCVWKGECPALKTPNSPCYAQREFEKPYLIKEIQRASSINLGSLKMSYLILRHPSLGWPTLEEKKLYRVTSPAVDSFSGKRFYLCGSDGKKQLSSHLASHPPHSRGFEFLRRGELISVSHALEKAHSLEIIQDTVVKIEAARGKPLPESSEGYE